MQNMTVRFPRVTEREFLKTLRTRVRGYFEDNNISTHGNSEMVWKTVAMLSIYLLPYLLMMTGIISHPLLITLCWLVMGVGVAGIGMSVMHDANHSAYSKNAQVNRWIGNMLELVGGFTPNWKIQHNRLHHSYTNIEGHDEDIAIGDLMRFSPHQRRLKFHRFQHVYAWFLYALMTLAWAMGKDFAQLAGYWKRGLLGNKKARYTKMMATLTINKILYVVYMIVIPIMVLPIPWWAVLILFVAMHLVSGLILASIFQLAHVMPTTEFPLPDEIGEMENEWAVHQLVTTTNFAPENKLLGWYVGGLNFQVEHHLFPNICHIHYAKLSKIVKATAEEFGVTYNMYKTLGDALKGHWQMLFDLGHYDALPQTKAEKIAVLA